MSVGSKDLTQYGDMRLIWALLLFLTLFLLFVIVAGVGPVTERVHENVTAAITIKPQTLSGNEEVLSLLKPDDRIRVDDVTVVVSKDRIVKVTKPNTGALETWKLGLIVDNDGNMSSAALLPENWEHSELRPLTFTAVPVRKDSLGITVEVEMEKGPVGESISEHALPSYFLTQLHVIEASAPQ